MITAKDALRVFLHLDKGVVLSFGLLSAFLIYLIFDQIQWWESNPDYSFGYIVPMFLFFVIYDRWSQIKSIFFGECNIKPYPILEKPLIIKSFSFLATVGLLLGLLFILFSGLVKTIQGSSPSASLALSVGFAAFSLCLIYLVNKYKADGTPLMQTHRLKLVSLFLFPSTIWLISAPLLNSLENQLNLLLMDKVSFFVASTFNALAIPITQEGNVLIFPNQDRVGVEEACSGIRSLTGCIFSGAFLGAVFLNYMWKKVLLLVCAVGLAFLTNFMRSFTLTALSYQNGSQVLNEQVFGMTIHDFTGYVVLGLTTIGLLCIVMILNIRNIIYQRYEKRMNKNNQIDSGNSPA